MLKIYRNKDNKLVLHMEFENSEPLVIEVMDEYCIFRSENQEEQAFFSENVMEVHTEMQGSSIFLRKELDRLHVYNNQQLDVYIR